jgi:hypothetical protein
LACKDLHGLPLPGAMEKLPLFSLPVSAQQYYIKIISDFDPCKQ